MSASSIDSLKIKAKLLQKAKSRAGKPVRLKDAFELIAKTSGFRSWRELRELYEATEHYCPAGSSAHWKTWFRDYEEARQHLGDGDNFLLPYRNHFFLCEPSYIAYLGVDLEDGDLALVGRNWVEPQNAAAFARLSAKLKAPR